MNGAMVNVSAHISESLASDIVNTTSTALIPAQAGARVLISNLIITNSHATQGTVVKVLDGTTLKWRGYAGPGGGFTLSFGRELVGSVNTAWNIQCETSGASIQASAVGWRASSEYLGV